MSILRDKILSVSFSFYCQFRFHIFEFTDTLHCKECVTVLSQFILLHKISYFHLLSWFDNFVETHSFRIVSSEPPKTLQKLCVSTNFPHQEIMWNFDVIRSVSHFISRLAWKSIKLHFDLSPHIRRLVMQMRFIIRDTSLKQQKIADTITIWVLFPY